MSIAFGFLAWVLQMKSGFCAPTATALLPELSYRETRMEAATLVGSLLHQGQMRGLWTELVATEVQGSDQIWTGFEDRDSENSVKPNRERKGGGLRQDSEVLVPRNQARVSIRPAEEG